MSLKDIPVSHIYPVIVSGLKSLIPDVDLEPYLNQSSFEVSSRGSLLMKGTSALITAEMLNAYQIRDLDSLEVFFKTLSEKHKQYIIALLAANFNNIIEIRKYLKPQDKSAALFTQLAKGILVLLYGKAKPLITLKEIIDLLREHDIEFNRGKIKVSTKEYTYEGNSQVKDFNKELAAITLVAKTLKIPIPENILIKQAKHNIKRYFNDLKKRDIFRFDLSNLSKLLSPEIMKSYAKLDKMLTCNHAQLTINYGEKGFDIACTECLLKLRFHPLLGIEINDPLTLAQIDLLDKQIAKTLIKQEFNKVRHLLGDFKRKRDDLKNSGSLLQMSLSYVENNLKRLQEFIDGIEKNQAELIADGFVIGQETVKNVDIETISKTFNILLLNIKSYLKNPLKFKNLTQSKVVIILKTIAEHNDSFGTTTFALLLKGSKSKKLWEYGLIKSVYYGALANSKQEDIVDAIESLKKMGILKVQLKGAHDLPIINLPAKLISSLDELFTEAKKDPLPLIDPFEDFKNALEDEDLEKIKAMCATNFAFQLYLEANKILIPSGKVAKIKKKLSNEVITHC